MHFFGITVVIICKFLEVVKSNTIILIPDCNNHLHTLGVKKKVLNFIIFGENKGGAGHLVRKKHTFLGRQKFLADGVAGGPKIWPGGRKLLVWPGSSRICFLSQKKKSYVTLKSVNSKFLKNMVPPPLKRTLA